MIIVETVTVTLNSNIDKDITLGLYISCYICSAQSLVYSTQ